FLGETPESRLPEIRALMIAAASRMAPFELVFGGVGVFESLEDPRVVWIGLDQGAAEMEKLAGLLGRDEPRPFSPHLTLGRRRREPAPNGFLAALRAEPALALRRPVDRIILYASRPAPFGHAYEILFEAAVGG
ncbi:MAG: 2'-5' RNA ligase, partial [Elusimicrobia bacterium RBG_16_66_12]